VITGEIAPTMYLQHELPEGQDARRHGQLRMNEWGRDQIDELKA
jgi:hypothetical protein